MSEFEAKPGYLKKSAGNEENISKKINNLSKDIRAVAAKIQLDANAERKIRQNLTALAQSNTDNASKIKKLSSTLDMIASYYEKTEQKIAGEEASEKNSTKDKMKKILEELMERIREIGEWLGMDSASFFSGDPVNLANGNYVYEKNFFNFDTILPINIRFFYNVKSKRTGTLGMGWLHNFECCIYKADDSVRLLKSDGDEELFVQQAGEWQACAGSFGKLIQDETGYSYTSEEGYISSFDKDGKWLSMATVGGWKIELCYENDRLSNVACTDGIKYEFCYDEVGRLRQIKDYTGRTVTLDYTEGHFSAVTDPLGNVTGYEYDGQGHLAKIITPLHNIGLYNEYDHMGRTVVQTFPDGGQVKYLYDDEKRSVVMIQQNGERTEYIHDTLYRNTKVLYSDGEETITYNENNQKTSFTDKLGNQTLYGYDEEGRLTGITNALGNKLQLSYNAHGQVNEVLLDDVRQSRCEFDAAGRQKKTINANDAQVEFEYDALGRVIKTVHEDGSVTALCYDKNGNIVLVEDPLAGTTKYVYDDCHRVIQTVDALGNETGYFYDQNDNLVQVIDAEGNDRKYEYDAQGNLIRLQDFNRGVTEVEYNSMNKPLRVKDADGNVTRYEYDQMSNVISVTTADGAQTFYEYDGQNRRTKIIYPSGGEETAVYDACGNIKKRVAQDGGEYSFEYDALGRPTAVTDPEGRTRRAVFDNQGNVTDIFYEDGSEEHFQFDLLGNRVFWQDKTGYCRYYSYDVLNNITQIRDDKGILVEYTYFQGGMVQSEKCIDGAEVKYQYDALGNVSCVESSTEGVWKFQYDRLGRVIRTEHENIGTESYEYDAVGNVTAVIDGEGKRSQYEYSLAGALLRVTDQNGVQTGYRYDGCYRLLDIIQPENGHVDIQKLNEYNRSQKDVRITSYTRDISGHVCMITDPEGNKSEYFYDLCGRIISHKDEDGNTTNCVYRKDGTEEKISFQDGRSIRYQYDALKRLIQIEDWLGKTQFERDAEGRLLHVTDHSGKETRYQWDERGACTQIIYPDGKKAVYEYDDLMHLIKTKYEDQIAQYTYYGNGRRKERSLQNGLISKYVYDPSGNISELSHFQDGNLISQYQYFYDKCGRKNRIIERQDAFSEAVENKFYYNALGAISSVEKNGKETERYSYDIFGNRIESFCGGVETTYGYDRLNRLTVRETAGEIQKYSYDRRGNLSGIASNGIQKLTMHFDALNRLATAKSDMGEAAYEYNGLDVLTGVRKQTEGQSKKEQYFYDYTSSYRNLISLQCGDQKSNYVWDQELLFESGQSGSAVFLNDERMNPVRLFSNGNMQERYSYDTWGKREKQMMGGTGNLADFGFTGYRMDEITGYYYAGKRNYDSATGRFIAQDPVAGSIYRPVSCNPFIYCACDPINQYDPTGAVAAWLAGGIIGAVSNLAVKVAGDIVDSAKNGHVSVSSWQSYVASATGGFVQGSVYVATGSSEIAGAAGCASETFISNGLNMISGVEGYRSEDGYTVANLFFDTAKAGKDGAISGFVFGKAGKYIKIPGITSGRGNWDAVVRGKLTAAAHGFVKNIGVKTIMKGIVTQGIVKMIDSVIDKGISAVKEAVKNFAQKIVTGLFTAIFGSIAAWPAALALIFTGGRSAACPAAGI